MNLEKVQVKTYTGSMESLEDLVRDLKLDTHEYHFNALTKNIYINRDNCPSLLRPGDCYRVPYMEPERFEAV